MIKTNFNPLMGEMAKNFGNAIKEFSPELISIINDEWDETKKFAVETFNTEWKKFIESIKEKKTPENVIAKDVELLDSKTLLEIAKENIVKEANEVYAMKKQKGDNMFVYLAYGKDKTLFENEKNKYVIIKAEALKADVLSLFKDSELVILK